MSIVTLPPRWANLPNTASSVELMKILITGGAGFIGSLA
jgi:hypothetical protein